MSVPRLRSSLALMMGLPLLAAGQGLAQTEGWLLGPNSAVGKQSEIVPTNCVTSADGAITCDTQVRNPEGSTPAKPYYNPFKD